MTPGLYRAKKKNRLQKLGLVVKELSLFLTLSESKLIGALQKKFFQKKCELRRIGRRNMNRRLNFDRGRVGSFKKKKILL